MVILKKEIKLYLHRAFLLTVATAQVITRLNLNWIGGPTRNASITFKLAMILTVVLFVSQFAIIFITTAAIASKNTTLIYLAYPLQLFQKLYFFYLLVVGIRIRMYIRKRYDIHDKCCGGVEDCCYMFFCPCCTVSQMARHTTDCDIQTAKCCSKTGLLHDVSYLDVESANALNNGQRLV